MHGSGQDANIQKISDQIELTKGDAQVVANEP